MQAWLHPLRPTQPIHVLSGTFVYLKKQKAKKKKREWKKFQVFLVLTLIWLWGVNMPTRFW